MNNYSKYSLSIPILKNQLEYIEWGHIYDCKEIHFMVLCTRKKKFRSWNHLRKGMKEIIKSVIDYA